MTDTHQETRVEFSLFPMFLTKPKVSVLGQSLVYLNWGQGSGLNECSRKTLKLVKAVSEEVETSVLFSFMTVSLIVAVT